ncbi:hypothetical protein CKO45_09905 [Paracraurococcus ruber]|uniref:Uncharacterized protein n=2 Tax=Paracraurococcus ruber TaxID=77675 RepID=A0ABS1CVK4_9PROT|nr:hypothetical protein [Paracraurococcus ruber]
MGRILAFAPRLLHGYPSTAAALEPAETLLLLATRGWVEDARRAADPWPRLGAMAAAAGLPPAAASLDMLLRVIARTARRPLAIGCPGCPGLGPDEQRLLHAARLAQGRETGLARQVLREGWLSDQGARFAIGPLQGLGDLFLAAGFVLRPRLLPDRMAPEDGAAAPWPAAHPPRH